MFRSHLSCANTLSDKSENCVKNTGKQLWLITEAFCYKQYAHHTVHLPEIFRDEIVYSKYVGNSSLFKR